MATTNGRTNSVLTLCKGRYWQLLDENPKRLFLALLIPLACSIGLFRVEFSYDSRAFFAPTSPAFQQLQEFESKYAKSNNLVILVRSSDASVALTDVESLRQIQPLVDAAWRLPFARRVDSLFNYKHAQGDSDDIGAEDFISIESLARNQPNADAIRSVLAGDPTVSGRLIAEDLGALGIVVDFALPAAHPQRSAATAPNELADAPTPSDSSHAIRQISAAANELINAFERDHPQFQLDAAGVVPLMWTFGEAAKADMRLLIPLGLGVSSLTLLILLGSVRLALPVLLVSGAAGASCIGAWSLLGAPFNSATTVAPIIVLVLTMAAGVHLAIAVQNNMAATRDPVAAVRSAIAMTARPSALAYLTTVVGFASFHSADAPPFRELGYIVIIGISVGYVLLYTAVPALYRCVWHPQFSGQSRLAQWLPRLAHRRRQAALAVGAIALLTIPGVGKLSIDDDFKEYFDESFDYRLGVNAIREHLSGLSRVEFDLPHPDGGSVTDPAYVQALSEFASWIRRQPNTTSTQSFVDAIRQIARAMPEQQGRLPETQAQLAEHLFLYELSLGPGESLNDAINVDRTSARITSVLRDVSSSELTAFADQAAEYLAQQSYFTAPAATSLNLLFARLAIDNVKSMMLATAVSLLLIALIVGFALRRVRYGLACLCVSVLPLAASFGIWGWGFGSIGLPGAVIVALTIGIIIDDAIHFIHRYDAARTGDDHEGATRYSLATAGHAMLSTTIALVAGFATLLASGFLINAQLGLFACIVFSLALLFCVGLLPVLLGSRPQAASN